jgi:hypothetical protein
MNASFENWNTYFDDIYAMKKKHLMNYKNNIWLNAKNKYDVIIKNINNKTHNNIT